MTPADYKVLEQRYLLQQKEREELASIHPLDDLKREARERNSARAFAHNEKPTSKRPEHSR